MLPDSYLEGAAIDGAIADILEHAPDVSSHTAIASDRYAFWPFRYHLSNERSFFLRHLDFTGLTVCEIGSGMGALSRYLAEHAGQLVCIETDAGKAKALKARLRDLKNWEHILDETSLGKRKFDVVVVGDWGAASARIPDLANFLTPAGVLIIGSDNKLGLKYLNGCREELSGMLYRGLASEKLLGRQEWIQTLTQAGFSELHFHYPFPDHKMTATVITDKLVDEDPGLASELASYRWFENYGDVRAALFPDGLALQSLSANRLFKDFANSFLIIASKDSASPVLAHLLRNAGDEQGWIWALGRKKPTKTKFRRSEKGGFAVTKSLLCSPDEKECLIGDFKWRETSEVVHKGPNLKSILLQSAYLQNWERFYGLLVEFLRWSFQRWHQNADFLQGEALDATVANCIVRDSKFELFDLEWIQIEAIPKSWFILRNLFALHRDFDVFTPSSGATSLAEMFRIVCQKVGVVASLECNIAREAAFQAAVSAKGDLATHQNSLEALFQRKFWSGFYPSAAASEWNRRVEGSPLVERMNDLESQVRGYRNLLNTPRHRWVETFNDAMKKWGVHSFLKTLQYALTKPGELFRRRSHAEVS